MVAVAGDEDLSFSAQAAEGFAVNDTIAVALKGRPVGVFRLRILSSASLRRFYRVWRKSIFFVGEQSSLVVEHECSVLRHAQYTASVLLFRLERFERDGSYSPHRKNTPLWLTKEEKNERKTRIK